MLEELGGATWQPQSSAVTWRKWRRRGCGWAWARAALPRRHHRRRATIRHQIISSAGIWPHLSDGLPWQAGQLKSMAASVTFVIKRETLSASRPLWRHSPAWLSSASWRSRVYLMACGGRERGGRHGNSSRRIVNIIDVGRLAASGSISDGGVSRYRMAFLNHERKIDNNRRR